MPRPRSILQPEFPYHVTARCINKEWFKIPLSTVWEIMSSQLHYVSFAFKAEILAFVLMPNHFHMLIRTPNSNLDLIMASFMKEVSRSINELSGRINQAYGARHFRGLIQSEHYFLHAYKYVYRNPVEAGLIINCQTYPYSSLSFLLGHSKALFPVKYDSVLFSNIEATIKWLNTEPKAEDWKKVGDAMGRSKFRLARLKESNKVSRLEFDMF